MALNLHGRSFLKELDFTPDELRFLLRLSADLKAAKYGGYEQRRLDGKEIALGSLEPQFYAELLRLTGLEGEDLPAQMDRAGWPRLRERFTEVFRTRTRAEWCELMEHSDACFAPVLTMTEAIDHPHVRARRSIVEFEGVHQPAPAPRFSRTVPELRRSPAKPGEHTDEVLGEWGFSADEIAKLRDAGAIASPG